MTPPDTEGSTSPTTAGQATKPEGELEAPPEFDRVSDVLGPLEQIILTADQKLGSIQEQVAAEARETSAQGDRRVREAAVEQRQQVAALRKELTDRVTELAGRFDGLLSVLDAADRELAVWAGEVQVTVTERQRVQISHETAAGTGAGAAPPTESTPPSAVAPPAKDSKPREEKGIRRWFRRSKRSSA